MSLDAVVITTIMKPSSLLICENVWLLLAVQQSVGNQGIAGKTKRITEILLIDE